MICFDIYVNDKKLCRAGFRDAEVLSSILSWAKLPVGEEDMFIQVGGLYKRPSGESVHPRWVDRLPIVAGDKITIEIVNAEDPDEPIGQTVESPEWVMEQKRKFFEYIKGELEGGENQS